MNENDRLRIAALNALSRREHSRVELRRKLMAKNFDSVAVEAELKRLCEKNLLSDERFSESYVYTHINKGQGPLRVRQGLQKHGIDDEMACAHLVKDEDDWLALARQVREKRFGSALPDNPKEYMRQARFLAYRGFTPEQVRSILKTSTAR